jgi:hypothetical protein
MRAAVGTAITLVIALLVAKLAYAPVHGVRNAEACEQAYAQATSRTDTIAVDMLSFAGGASGRIRRRCGELRAP